MVHTVFKKLICSLFVFILALSFVPSVGADAADTCATVEEMLAITDEYTFSGSYMDLKYRRYNSLNYDSKDDTVKSTLIVYFHDSEGKGDDNKAQLKEKNLVSQLISDTNADQAEYRYIVIAPQCPADQSFTSTVGVDYKFSGATDVMKTVKELVDDIVANNVIFANRVVVIGEGDGGTAAFDFLSRYPQTVSRAMAVDGFYDADKIATAEMVKDKAYRIVVSKGDQNAYISSLKVIDNLMKLGLESRCEYIEIEAGQDPVEYVLDYEEPSIKLWAVVENYDQKFSFTAMATEGGSVSPASQQVNYNGMVNFVIIKEDGYKINKVTINGEEIPKTNLKQNINNKNSYTYQVSIKKDTVVNVEFTAVVSEGGKYDTTIGRAIKWASVLGIACLALGVLVYAIDMILRQVKKNRADGEK